jgi:acyl dehydratase
MSSNQIPSVGDLGPVVSFGPISRTDIVRYVGASGDFNPIHHDEEFAQTAGFPTVFSVGMLQAGLLATYATDWLGARNLRRYVMRFKEQVWPGDELTCHGTVTEVVNEASRTTVHVSLNCTRQTGGTAIEASATFVLPSNAS